MSRVVAAVTAISLMCQAACMWETTSDTPVLSLQSLIGRPLPEPALITHAHYNLWLEHHGSVAGISERTEIAGFMDAIEASGTPAQPNCVVFERSFRDLDVCVYSAPIGKWAMFRITASERTSHAK